LPLQESADRVAVERPAVDECFVGLELHEIVGKVRFVFDGTRQSVEIQLEPPPDLREKLLP
jgi:hypothetical protein